MNPAKEWICACGAKEIQTGARALELLPTPPFGWALVDIVTTLPPRSMDTPDGKAKMGETRHTKRRAYCPSCFVKFSGVV